ncbi:uncharacterized protein V1518DRAFT_415656 [Limtongia smithiae]|uniref:uncharacterized protein n=1 Tax=Limtongia smithiae TaxID=1125753 RepID=UPI0034CD8896
MSQGTPIPAWMLSPKDGAEATARQARQARERCHVQLVAFSECNSGRSVSTSWACREQNKAMMECMVHYMQPEFRDRFVQEVIEEKLAARTKNPRSSSSGVSSSDKS